VRTQTRAGEAVLRASLFVLPFALAFVYVVSVLAVVSADAWPIVWGGMITYLLAPVGTEVVIPAIRVGLLSVSAAPWEFALAVLGVVLVDVFTALWVAWNWDLVERVPRLGWVVRRVEHRCHAILAKKKWGERATLAALAAYVAMPVQMTGGLFSSVMGRMMGIDKVRVFAAVSAGSAIGAVPMAIVAWVAGPSILVALQSPTVQTVGIAAGILTAIAFIAAVAYLYVRGKRNEDRG